MVFNTPEWRMVAKHEPLCNPDIARLKKSIEETCMVAHGIVMFGIALKEFCKYETEMQYCSWMD